MLTKFLVTLATISAAAAHGGVIGYTIAGQYYPGFVPYTPTGQSTIQRQWATYDPIYYATDGSISCNRPGTPTNPQLTATVSAGSQITAHWSPPWPHELGPVIVHLANCGVSCTNAIPSNLNWFKIDEAGLISGTLNNGYWGARRLIENNFSWTSTIPRSLPTGNYLIRHDIIALHQPYQPEFYPECAQLNVINGGGGNPGPTVRFPGGYTSSDPNIIISLPLSSGSSYTVPGGPIWRG